MKKASARKNKRRSWRMADDGWKTARHPKIPSSIFHPASPFRLFFMASIGVGVIIHALKCQETRNSEMQNVE
jgi:hypothetical protein